MRGGGVEGVVVIVISIIANYLLGIWINCSCGIKKKIIFISAIVFNLSLLFFFKYANFVGENILRIGEVFQISHEKLSFRIISLPIGISFFTFQVMSYIIDLYYDRVPVQKNILKLAIYVMMFPQLVAGPIVRYIDIANEMTNRYINKKDIEVGISRFTVGLAKKTIVANIMAEIVEWSLINLNTGNMIIAWSGALAYSFQIYYDFSAYSDMAIGMGLMMGFHFRENFCYPYISVSIKEFWRRWHISLSMWFRDYVYIPLGGNRKGKRRTYVNNIIVFVLTGIWHGAAWTYVLWGIWHGIFILLEKWRLEQSSKKIPILFGRIYTLLVVCIGWVLFRAESLDQFALWIKSMFTGNLSRMELVSGFIDSRIMLSFVLAVIFSMPIVPIVKEKLEDMKIWVKIRTVSVLMLYLISIIFLSGSDFNPFIYFKF